jgi:hypothetical protein
MHPPTHQGKELEQHLAGELQLVCGLVQVDEQQVTQQLLPNLRQAATQQGTVVSGE